MPEQDILSFLPHYLIRSQLYYIAVVGMDGCYVYVNPCFEQRFSFITDNFIGKHSYIAIYHEDHTKCEAAVQECLAYPNRPVSLILRKPNMSINDFYWTQWEFSALKDADGNMIGVL
ncbi:MAG: PAS domain-containing protein, partial [Thermoflexibacteraceae bacterium]